MDDYPKIRRRLKSRSGFAFIEPTMTEKKVLLTKMNGVLKGLNIQLATCCENQVLENMPLTASISSSACISNALLMELYGGRLSCKQDTGQRVKQGCGCSVSVDIGSYNLHPCYHNCLFCYGNPVSIQNSSLK